ncbi:hypothetical protein ABOM_006674 [Aspergillus bombycis]|uniref:Isopenicillin N synthase-like Fe(2+) 2OG dioxygenase domain-containing protein n=1 Tax=Aspergillus bombycis TaxID=109264 RepID=A0A1F8A1B7_9EURO|nr:hypothetical protein ABOM_006674 [Aspergillus bombycis]OGM45098.1 hypothetical protein ABOM_006674 [Aspergillus bombycis]
MTTTQITVSHSLATPDVPQSSVTESPTVSLLVSSWTRSQSVLDLVNTLTTEYVQSILSSLSAIADTDLTAARSAYNVKFRLCDHNPITAGPEYLNGCGAHVDYGAINIAFKDGPPGLELKDANVLGSWIPVPGDATVTLTGWCVLILSGGRIAAARYHVRRIPDVRRLGVAFIIITLV